MERRGHFAVVGRINGRHQLVHRLLACSALLIREFQFHDGGFLGISVFGHDNVFVGAPTGSGKTICAEFALLRLWSKREQPRAVCIEPYQDMVDLRVAEWRAKFGKLQGGKEIVSLTGETTADLRLLEKGDLIVCTPSQVR